MYDIPDKKDVSEIVINEDVIDEHKEPVYVYKKKNTARSPRELNA